LFVATSVFGAPVPRTTPSLQPERPKRAPCSNHSNYNCTYRIILCKRAPQGPRPSPSSVKPSSHPRYPPLPTKLQIKIYYIISIVLAPAVLFKIPPHCDLLYCIENFTTLGADSNSRSSSLLTTTIFPLDFLIRTGRSPVVPVCRYQS
jgi:hypothetical protein